MLPVSVWANRFRRLSPEASATPGQFDINRTPFMREIADSFGDRLVAEVRVMKSSQVAYSENLNNFLGRQIHLNPGPIMMMQPTLEMAEGYSKDRISTMIRDTPVLTDLIDDRSKTSGNTILKKSFPGGLLQMVGGNSPASLASRPIRDVVIDEEDRTAASAGKEGDPEKLATRRQITFHDRKLVAGGTPVIKGASKTDRGFKKGDQRHYMVECPCCGGHIDFRLKQFQTNPDKEHYAAYQCQLCNEWIDHSNKMQMIKDYPAGGTAYWEPMERRRVKGWNREKNEWTREAEPIDYEWDAKAGRYIEAELVVRSYHIWAAYSPFITWKEICDEYNQAKSDPELLQTFYNTLVGLPYEYTTNDLDFEYLYKRREKWDEDSLTDKILAITAGVDTQDDRFEYTILGFGAGEEVWVLDFGIIDGDPEDRETRERLHEFLMSRQYQTEKGRKMRVRGYFVDLGGHRTDSVYKLTRGKQYQHVYACKGMNTAGNPIFAGFSRQKEAKVKIARVGTDTAKEQIYAKLAKDEGEPGTIHFADHLTIDYFEGLVSEERKIVWVKGQPKIRYEKKKKSVRNEPLDCFVYAYACLRSMKIQLRKASRRMMLEQRRAAEVARKEEESRGSEGGGDGATGEKEEQEPPKSAARLRRRRKVKMVRKRGRRR